ncbi:adenylate kinase 7 [Betta splendens]|uniref:Adenylate kinase 7 n=1 Tax=Betta splendens TaxID=158456 RepID=A0A6P7LPG2_BETSP|nr:adenylate kinase 7 [Betta splendens]
MEAGGETQPRRVFINNVNSYASKHIAKFLSGCFLGAFPNTGESEEEGRISSVNGTRAFQIVGTISEESDEERPYVLEEYFQLGRDELLPKLMDCDVVVYNITQHTNQIEEALWAVTALHNNMKNFSRGKMFILISTVMTWAGSKPVKPDDQEIPFTDEIFWRRRAHPNFTQHIDLEKRVVKMGKTDRRLFSTYVVASGLQYGMGEQIFHYFYKTSWLGEEQEIPVFGDGNNILPTIHINDLASVLQNVIQQCPELYYFLAVDNSNNTMKDIVKAIASALGPGKIQTKPHEEAFLIKELSVMEIDTLLVNLCMKGVLIKDLFSVSWLCESGLVDNIGMVVEEYRRARGLLPVRLCVLGPPAVGKSTVSKEICKHYKLQHITLKETISETIALLNNAVNASRPNAENDSAESQELLNRMQDSMKENGGLLEDQLLLKVVRDKLMSNPCSNQGFVLDGFPKTYKQAKELFSADEYESEDGTASYKKIMPEFVLVLDASDAFLKDRVINLPERLVQEHKYDYFHFVQRLARYRKKHTEDETVVNYFDELDINPLYLEVTSNDESDCLILMQKVFDMVGKPRNYGPSTQEVEEGDRRKAEEEMRREAQMRAEEEKKALEEAQQRHARWEKWTKDLEKQRQQEEELLEAQTVHMRSYLMEHVMPTLTQGLTECCTFHPEDPVDFLAEYLFKNSPANY